VLEEQVDDGAGLVLAEIREQRAEVRRVDARDEPLGARRETAGQQTAEDAGRQFGSRHRAPRLAQIRLTQIGSRHRGSAGRPRGMLRRTGSPILSFARFRIASFASSAADS